MEEDVGVSVLECSEVLGDTGNIGSLRTSFSFELRQLCI